MSLRSLTEFKPQPPEIQLDQLGLLESLCVAQNSKFHELLAASVSVASF